MTALPDFGIALPELVLGGLALILLLVGTFGRDRSTGLVSALAAISSNSDERKISAAFSWTMVSERSMRSSAPRKAAA